jgi:hypothetical protein
VGPPIAAARSVFFPQGGQLWRADGTATGTVQLTNLPSDQAIGPLVSYQGNLAFVVLSPSATSLWQSDGTPQGTVKLLDLPLPPGAQFDKLSTAGGLLFYTTLDPTQFTPPQVWRSDGTVAGTYVLASMLYLDSTASAPIAVGGSIYFIGRQPDAIGLWRTDGTARSEEHTSELQSRRRSLLPRRAARAQLDALAFGRHARRDRPRPADQQQRGLRPARGRRGRQPALLHRRRRHPWQRALGERRQRRGHPPGA